MLKMKGLKKMEPEEDIQFQIGGFTPFSARR
jgi:hypothetical protein